MLLIENVVEARFFPQTLQVCYQSYAGGGFLKVQGRGGLCPSLCEAVLW